MIFWKMFRKLYLKNALKFICERGQVKNIDDWGLKKKAATVSKFRIELKMSTSVKLKIEKSRIWT